MCLYPRQMVNKKYTVTKKNGGCVPTLEDERTAYVQIPCGHCIECKKQKAREWQVRLNEEIKNYKYTYFLTLTFTNKSLVTICKKMRVNECNAVAGYAIRHCLERYRKDHKKSLKHWFITELGHEGTERIHLHGLIFTNEELEFEIVDKDLKFYKWKYWKYGNIFVGDYCNSRTINYIVKYMHKIDEDHPGFEGQVLCSPGIGRNFTETELAKTYKYKPGNSKDYYILQNGAKTKLPTYYKNKFYNEDEREKIWRESMDKNEFICMGNKYNTTIVTNEQLGQVIKKQQEVSTALGYGDDSDKYKRKEYNITRRMLARAEAQKDLIRKYQESMKKLQENVKNNKKYLHI